MKNIFSYLLKSKFIHSILLFIVCAPIFSQTPTVQDCEGAIPVCQNIYTIPDPYPYSGNGNYLNEINPFAGCVPPEDNGAWYLFTTQTAGNISFIITPNNGVDDYDWVVYNLTNANCSDLSGSNAQSIYESANTFGTWSNNGPTGVSTANGGVGNCNGPGNTNGPIWNQDIVAQTANTFVLYISNWSASSSGYTLDFSPSTATIFDNIDPYIQAVSQPIACSSTTLSFNFSENILCSSLDDADFTLTGPGGPYSISGVTGAACVAGAAQENNFNATVSPALTLSGVYSLCLVSGSGFVEDLCANTAPAACLNFNITQDPQPPVVNCWDNFVFNTTTCVWDNTGTQNPQPPVVNCWDNFVFNTTTCVWDNTGTQNPQPPVVNCWDNFVFNTTTCVWDNTGTQNPQPPVVNCWDNFVFNTTTCVWDNTGTQNPQPPVVNCWDNFVFNTTTCVWDNTGTQNPQPPVVNCWDNFVFNTTTCVWDNTGTQNPQPPVVNCWDNFVFNTTTCVWDNTGTQNPQPPVVNCWDNFVFNTTTCVWDNTESQPIPPILDCYETLGLFNTTTCAWNIDSNDGISLNFIATSPICRYDESTLSINISNSEYNTFTISLQDSILKSFVIDTNGLLIPEGVPITLSPNYSGNVYIVSLEDNDGCPGIYNDNVHIQVKQLPQLAINQQDICEGSPSFALNNATPNGGFYSINNELTDYLDVENLGAGMYNIGYTYTDPITSCTNQINEVVTIMESPKAGILFSPQPTDIDNPTIFFRDNSNEIVLYSEWDLGDGTIINDEPNFWHTYADTGTYTIKYYITNIYGCTDSVIKDLTINPIYVTFIPAAFTPNNDGDNDYFYPSIIGGNSYNMKIYNRWGEIIYNEDNGTWDGKINENAVQHGFYSYSILVTDFKNKSFIYTGIVNLIK